MLAMGFANFHHCFIHNYSFVSAPLTALTSSEVPFWWMPAAEEAFQTPKSRFTSVPILQLPDLEHQLVVGWMPLMWG